MFKIRKIMAIILALAMTLSMFNVGIVAAGGETDTADEAVTVESIKAKVNEFASAHLTSSFMKPQKAPNTNSANVQRILDVLYDYKEIYRQVKQLSDADQKSLLSSSVWTSKISSSTNGSSLNSRLANCFKGTNAFTGDGSKFVVITLQSPDGKFIDFRPVKLESLTYSELAEITVEIKTGKYAFESAHLYNDETPITDEVDLSEATDWTLTACVVVEVERKVEISEEVQAFLDAVAALEGKTGNDITLELLQDCIDAYSVLSEKTLTADELPLVNEAKATFNKAKAEYDELHPEVLPDMPSVYSGDGWKYYTGEYTDTNGDVFDDNTLVITAKNALASGGYYNSLDTELTKYGISYKEAIKHVVIDFTGINESMSGNDWTYITKLTNLETVTVRGAGTVTGPSVNLKSWYKIEDCGTVQSHKGLSFPDNSGKIIVKNTTSISDFAFTTDTASYVLSKAIPGLTSVEIENVKTINQGAFAGNTDLTNVTIKFTTPGLRGILEVFAFYRCPKLAEVHFDLAECQELQAGIFGPKTGFPGTNVTADNFSRDKTKVGDDTFYDQLKNNPFKLEELSDEKIIEIYGGQFELEPMESITLGLDESYTSSKVGENSLTQITKSARWASGSDSKAEVELKFAFNKKPGHDYLILLDVSKSSGDTWDGYSKLNIYKSFVIEAARALLTTEGYDNRIGIIPFIDNNHPLDEQSFSGSYDEIKTWMLNMKVPKDDGTSTQTRIAFDKAVDMVNGRADKSHEVEIILVSDGAVSIEEYSTGEALTFKDEDRNAFNASFNALQALGINIYCVASLDNNTELSGNPLTYMGKVATGVPDEAIDESTVTGDFEAYEGKLLYSANNIEGFGAAIKFVLNHIISEYEITDYIDSRFTVDAGSISASEGTTAKLSEDGKSIKWTIQGLPYQEYTLNFTESLIDPKNDPNSFGNSINTNYGYAEVDDVGVQPRVNRVDTPVLGRPLPSYTITVHYREEGTNATVQADTSDSRLRFESYKYDLSNAPQTIGNYFFTGNYSGPLEYDSMTGDAEITLYYKQKYNALVLPNGGKYVYNGENQSVSDYKTMIAVDDGGTYTVEGITAGVSGKNVGVYPVEVTGTPVVKDSTGTDVTYKFNVMIGAAELEITPKDVTFKSETLTQKYNGEPLTANGEATADGLVGSDTVTFTAGEGRIEYPGTVTGGNNFGVVWGNPDIASNYNVTTEFGDLIMTDGEYAITVQPLGGKFPYDGTEHSVEGFETLTFKLGDNEYTVEGLTAGISGTNVGVYNVAVNGTAVVKDAAGIDVTSSFTVTVLDATLEITPIAAVVKANDKAKTYGESDPDLDATVEGLVEGDTINYNVTRVPGEDVGEYEITAAGEAVQGNYTVTYEPGMFTVDPRPVTVTADSRTKVYGDIDPELTAVVEGLLGSDTVAYTVGRAPGEDVGEYAITPTGEGRQGNYIVYYVPNTLTITPKTIVVVPNDDEKVYGDEDPILSATVNGIVETDRITYTLSREYGENVGEYVITSTGDPIQGNYIVEYETATFTINPRTVIVRANNESKVYGDVDPELTAEAVGLLEGDTVVFTVGRDSGENVGRYTVAPSGETVQGNYIVEYETAIFTIDPRPVTVIANSYTKTEGEEDPEFTAVVEGLLEGDTVSYGIARELGEDPGVYEVMPSGAEEQGNYVVEYIPGTLVIIERDIEPGSLTVRKNVTVNGGEIPADKVFYFDITGPNGYSTTLELTADTAETIDELVPGEYTVTERTADAQVSGYSLNVTGEGSTTVPEGGNAAVTVTNTYSQTVGSLTITKNVVGGGALTANKTYTFDITDAVGNIVSASITGAGTAIVDNLAPGEYTVTERDANIDGYSLTVTGEGTVTVVANGVTPVAIANTYIQQVGSIEITKNVVGGGALTANKTYTFDITDAAGNTVSVSITGAGTAIVDDLAPGSYTVTERDANVEGYRLNVTGEGTVTVVANGVTPVVIANYYNQVVGSLTITKNVVGGENAGAADREYTFSVTGPNGYNGTVTVAANGSVTLENLAPGVYTVTEINAEIPSYRLETTGTGTVEVVAATDTAVTVTNRYTELRNVSVVKEWYINGIRTSAPANAVITVRLYADGVSEGSFITLSAATNWLGSFNDLPVYAEDGHVITYYVAEDSYENWTPITSGNADTGFVISNYMTTITPNQPGNEQPNNPEPDIDIPEPDIPLVDTPDPEIVPEPEVVPAPEPEIPEPVFEIPDTDIPLTDTPEPAVEFEIPDTDIPLLDTVPETGDNSNLALWISLMIASGAGIAAILAALLVGKKKAEAEEE